MVAILEKPKSLKFPTAAKENPFMAMPAGTGAERRVFPRKEVHFRVSGMRLDHTVTAHKMPHLSFALRDVSFGGLCGISQQPLTAGERLSVFFPPEGTSRGWDAYGRVIRCDPSGTGYRVAVEFDPLPAA